MIKVQTAILKTLAYADVFNYPLAPYEIWKYLIECESSWSEFYSSLVQLESRQKIAFRQGFYHLPHRRKIISLRKKRQKIAADKLIYTQKLRNWFKLIPYVWFVGVSGSLAMANTRLEDDIDVFIITAPRRLWTTRMLCTLLLDILGVRRKPDQQKTQDKLCLNMFMDGGKLGLPVHERDLYLAHEVVQLQPILSRYQTYERFINANRWLKRFLPQAVKFSSQNYQLKVNFRPEVGKLEFWLKKLQLKYMQQRRSKEFLGKYLLRFHPQDARSWVMREYGQRLELLGFKSG